MASEISRIFLFPPLDPFVLRLGMCTMYICILRDCSGQNVSVLAKYNLNASVALASVVVLGRLARCARARF